MKIEVVKRFTFEAAHFLPEYKGACANMHGHTYVLDVGIKGEIDPKTGMVMDFTALKQMVKVYILDELDHKLLNEVYSHNFPYGRPTAENMVVWILKRLKSYMRSYKLFYGSSDISFIRLYETQNSYAEWRSNEK